jgi:hypothetical protein
VYSLQVSTIWNGNGLLKECLSASQKYESIDRVQGMHRFIPVVNGINIDKRRTHVLVFFATMVAIFANQRCWMVDVCAMV